jgi:hypothetical protein
MLPIVALLALPLAPQLAQSAPSTSVSGASDDALTAFAAARRGAGGAKTGRADRGASAKGTSGRSTGGKNANARNTSGKNANARNIDGENSSARHTNARNNNARNNNARNNNTRNTDARNPNGKSTSVNNTNINNTNVRNTNVNRGGAGSVAVVSPVRPWVPKPYYGTVVAGVTLGTLIVATTIPLAPASDLCWYWSNSSQTRGYWDYCQ